jgi:hypothetical protein
MTLPRGMWVESLAQPTLMTGGSGISAANTDNTRSSGRIGKTADFQPVGEAIYAVAGRIAPELIDLRVASGRSVVSWLASDLGERSPFASPFLF